MRLSAEQKRSLREWRARLMVESAAAVRQRAGLLTHLNCQILGDDARSMERIGDVRCYCCEPALTDRYPSTSLDSDRCKHTYTVSSLRLKDFAVPHKRGLGTLLFPFLKVTAAAPGQPTA